MTYTESGDLGTDLSAVTGTSDGQMDGIHSLRNSLGADLVKLVVGNTAAGACGVAWLMQSLSSGFAANAFSVTAYPCISPNYTFGHELGHNMGSNHAPSDPVTPPPLYAYSFGYKHPSNLFRTVMAYDCPVTLPARPVFLEPRGELQRRTHRHRGPAQQRAVHQQRAQHRRQLAAAGGGEHAAHDHGHRRSADRRRHPHPRAGLHGR